MTGVEEQLAGETIEMCVVLVQSVRSPNFGAKVGAHLGCNARAFIVIGAFLSENDVDIVVLRTFLLAIDGLTAGEVGAVSIDHKGGYADHLALAE